MIVQSYLLIQDLFLDLGVSNQSSNAPTKHKTGFNVSNSPNKVPFHHEHGNKITHLKHQIRFPQSFASRPQRSLILFKTSSILFTLLKKPSNCSRYTGTGRGTQKHSSFEIFLRVQKSFLKNPEPLIKE